MASFVARVAGTNARAIRLDAKVTLDRLAVAMKLCGLRWSTGRIASFESGHVPARIETLYTVALALGQATGRRITLPDLLAGEGDVVLNDELSIGLSALRDAVSGKPVTVGETEMTRKLHETMGKPPTRRTARKIAEITVRAEFREADFRVCKKLRVTPEEGALAMGRLWARTFAAERDLQAGQNANAQHRGNISRQLEAELQKALSNGDD